MSFNTKLITLCILTIRILSQSYGAPTIPGTNFVSYNKSCNDTFPCNPEALLTCIAGQCQCESPSNQKYNKDIDICLSTVGGHCSLLSSSDINTKIKNQLLSSSSSSSSAVSSSPSSIPRPCIKNAHCIFILSNKSYNYTECQCIPGYIENSDGECVPGIGMPCSYQSNECNPLGMVVCKNERCACLDKLQIYDYEIKRCVSPAGTHCKYDSLQLGCVKHAICYPFYYWVPPRCMCKPGYYQTTSRTCVLEHHIEITNTKTMMEDL